MNDDGQTKNADGTTTIRHIPSHEQLRTNAQHLFDELNYAYRAELNSNRKDAAALELIKIDIRKAELALNQLLIIANELEKRPEPSVIVNRIYRYLISYFNRRDPFVEVPAFVANKILEILTDQYAHLNEQQRELITHRCSEIIAAGNGSGDAEQGCMTYEQARSTISQESIESMLTHFDDDLSQYFDFDPDTGKEWSDE